MNTQETLDKLRQIMRQATAADIDWDAVRPDSKIADMGFDSLAILDLIYDLQQGFGLDFDAEEMARVQTVGELAEFLRLRQTES